MFEMSIHIHVLLWGQAINAIEHLHNHLSPTLQLYRMMVNHALMIIVLQKYITEIACHFNLNHSHS